MSLVHHWKFDEGSGSVAADSAGSADFTPVAGDSIAWSSARILGTNNMGFITIGIHDYDSTHVLQASTDTISAPWSFTFLFRHQRDNTGAVFRSLSGSFRIRNTDSDLDYSTSSDTIAISTTEYKRGKWHHIALVITSGGDTLVYLDGSLLRTLSGVTSDLDGTLQQGAYQSSGGFPSCTEVSDTRIYDHALSPAEVSSIFSSYGSRPATFAVSSDTDDFGLFLRHDDADSVGQSHVWNIVDNYIEQRFGGDYCQGGLWTALPNDLSQYWFRCTLWIPSSFDANHDFNTYFKIFRLCANYEVTPGTTICQVYFNHELPSQDVYSYRLFYNDLADYVDMTQVDVTKEVDHIMELFVDVTNGIIRFYWNSTLFAEVTGLSLGPFSELGMYYGLHGGCHPEGSYPDNSYRLKNLYAGETQYPPSIASLRSEHFFNYW
jgi:hypothetical protein